MYANQVSASFHITEMGKAQPLSKNVLYQIFRKSFKFKARDLKHLQRIDFMPRCWREKKI